MTSRQSVRKGAGLVPKLTNGFAVGGTSFRFASLAIAVAVLAIVNAPAFGQSGERETGSDQREAGSDTRGEGEAKLALDGYCPVCIVEMKQWIKGEEEYQVQLDGKIYLFPGEEQMNMFKENPNKYVPALGGDCTVCLVEMEERVPGSVRHTVLHEGRLYLFPGEEQKQMFLDDPDKYAKADLALDGNCAVCKIEMQQEIEGKPEFITFVNGFRYWFVNEDQLKMFLENPDRYVVHKKDDR